MRLLKLLVILPLFSFSQDTLHLLTWNIFLLPKMVSDPSRITRANLIADTLLNSEYDIIIFEEAFHRKARTVLSEKLKKQFPFQIGPAFDKKNQVLGNSGVWIVSRFPIDSVTSIRYKDLGHADMFTKKGVMLIQGNFNGHRFHLAATHAQAQDAMKYQKKRFKNYEQIALMLDKYKEDKVPQIILGDLNTEKKLSHHYDKMVSILGAIDPPTVCELEYTWDGKINQLAHDQTDICQILDYVLYRPNNSDVTVGKKRIVAIRKSWLKRKKPYTDLSDHFAIETDFIFKKDDRK